MFYNKTDRIKQKGYVSYNYTLLPKLKRWRVIVQNPVVVCVVDVVYDGLLSVPSFPYKDLQNENVQYQGKQNAMN